MTSSDARPANPVDPNLLRHHGDVDAAPELVDFAVNVRAQGPPRWLRDRLAAAVSELGRYPSESADRTARASAARRHGRDVEDVLVLNGAAECFTLLAALRPRLAALVHPSFTEPEVALEAAGVPITRVVLDAEDGYRLRHERVPDEADLVVLGNPTNPTSVLHPAEQIRALARPGRVVLVDEAFADAVPGEPESLAGPGQPAGVLVLRSLTKTWALPGLRAGYVLGDPDVLARLSRHRPQWPVGSLVLEAVAACCEPGAVREAEQAAEELAARTGTLADELAALPGVTVQRPARAPFLLVGVPGADSLRERLRQRGIAVRRGDTFPGLGADHVRIAVRDPDTNARLLAALRAELPS